jgi:hypothetical protein
MKPQDNLEETGNESKGSKVTVAQYNEAFDSLAAFLFELYKIHKAEVKNEH